MTSVMFIALALGVVSSLITSALRKKWPSMEARTIQLVVFAVCFLAAFAATLVEQYAPPEFIATLTTSFATAIAWFEVAMKEHKKGEE